MDNHNKILKYKFDKKYGEGQSQILITMLEDPLLSLQDTATYFGFSRETASRYFQKAFGFPYSLCQQKNPRNQNRTRFFRGREYQICVEGIRILRGKGFVPLLTSYKSGYRILVNGYIVAARQLFLHDKNKPVYYTAVKGISEVDFFLLFTAKPYGCSYLVPYKFMPRYVAIPYLSRFPYSNVKSKYQRFLNNFDVLHGVPTGCRGPFK